ncbi:hypothetical protein RA2_02466 [Roseovarius sp. A-2]|uniref:Hint domain-containing protein n=1 Tax=Roseovarius sp. A-2 TaxID=1570360 RepID=UPI0009B5087F|nr:Hint domain-containing protein [Roseovarius sp. A-2]GAW35403.1 hypothetical protein RA2_02466 [Roseovarius sp. A-2]
MSPEDLMTHILDNKTVIGNPNLLDELNLVDNRAFDPVLWFENSYQPGHGGEYRGPTTVEDLKAFAEYLEAQVPGMEKIATFDIFSGGDPLENPALAATLLAIAHDLIKKEVGPASVILPILGVVGTGRLEELKAQISSIKSMLDFLREGGIECFPAGTPIALENGTEKPIEDVQIGDAVLAHTPDGSSVPGEVTKLFRNTTEEFIRYCQVVGISLRSLAKAGSCHHFRGVICPEAESIGAGVAV